MPFQSIPECAEAVIIGQGGSKSIANVLGFWKPGGYNQTDIDNLAAAIDSVVGSDYLDWVAAGSAYIATTVRGLENVVDLSAINAANAGPGTMAGTFELPSNCSFCVTLRTGLTGRSARGRFYTWPMADSALSAVDTVTTTYANGIVTTLTGFQSAALAEGWYLSILSRRSLGAVRPVGTHYTVTGIAYRNRSLDSQRGRLPANH